MSVELGLILSLIGCFVGLAGWLTNRDKRVSNDSEWRGQVNAKLDVIVGMRNDLDRANETIQDYGERLAKVEANVGQAHHRIDELNRFRTEGKVCGKTLAISGTCNCSGGTDGVYQEHRSDEG